MPDPLVIECFPEGSQSNEPGAKQRTRSFWVYAANYEDSEAVLFANTGIRRGTTYQDHQGNQPDPWLNCRNIGGSAVVQVPLNGVGLWKLTCLYTYSNRISTPKPVFPNLIPRYWIETSEESVPIDHDVVNGTPITNASGEPIDPPMTIFKDRETLVIEWFKWGTDWLSMYTPKRQYRKKLNSDVYAGAIPGCLLCRDIKLDELPQRDPTNSFTLFKYQARLDYREPRTLDGTVYPGWHHVWVNAGRRVKTNDANKPFEFIREVMGDVNTPIAFSPMLIDPAGFNRLGNAADPNYRSARGYFSIDFVNLVT